MTPITHFNTWFAEEQRLTKNRIPGACCLSTQGTDGFPNARFVSLKDVSEGQLIVTGTLTSRKGIEIQAHNQVALTFWWTETERQVRIQGLATLLPAQLADRYFSERNPDSQIVSIVSDQGQELTDEAQLHAAYQDMETKFAGKPLTRPDNWGGYSIAPVRMEFLSFKPTRFHERTLFEWINGQWTVRQLQP